MYPIDTYFWTNHNKHNKLLGGVRMEFHEGDWVLIDLGNRRFKGFIFEKGVYRSTVNVFVPKLNDFSPHSYLNEVISPLPLDTFGNEKELYIDYALLVGDKETFQEVMNDDTKTIK